jgi:micrococcal nuclease
MPDSSQIQSPNIESKSNFGWIFGVLLAFFGFIGFMVSAFIPGLALLLMGLVLLPPIGKIVERKWSIKLTTAKKAIILSIGFFIFSITAGHSDSPKEQTPQLEQKAVTETKSEEQPKEEVSVPEQNIESDSKNDAQETAAEKKLYPVKKVVDGDTVQVTIDGKDEVLRLIGINTPETVDPRKPVECFGAEASAKSKEILNGKNVSLEADETQSDRDKYDRLLRYIYLEDGTNFNKLMIQEGYAYEYTYGTPYKYQAEFKKAQQEAKDAKRGLWAEDTCNGELSKSTTPVNPQPIPAPVKTETPTPSTGSFTCAGKHLCGQMTSCAEARFYLTSCGVKSLDADKDGVPCETLCN